MVEIDVALKLRWLRFLEWLGALQKTRRVFSLRCVARTVEGSERLIYLELFSSVEACRLMAAEQMRVHQRNPLAVLRWQHLGDRSKAFHCHWVATVSTPDGPFPHYTWEIIPKTIGVLDAEFGVV
ncbi:hypothetical protein [Deinococcus misasensis]|uniref:hypothetical protein n=1 Tax=Deinococcus misasensis TaxID=392413 RepID=UPI00054D44CA|nr:hypothetical protein [Deinococcus misasensis]